MGTGTIRTLNVSVKARTENFSAKMRQATEGVRRLNKETQSLGQRINRTFGESSALGNIGKFAVGAGAAAALGLAFRELEKIGTKAQELRDQYREGTISAGAMAAELATSLPVLDQLKRATLSWYAVFDDSAARAAKLTEQLGRANSTLDKLADVQGEIRLLRTPEALRPRVQLELDRASALRAIDAMRRDAASTLERAAVERLAAAVATKFDLQLAQLESPFRAMIDRLKKTTSGLWDSFAAGAKKAMNEARMAAESMRRELEGIASSVKSALETPAETVLRLFRDAKRAFEAGLLTADEVSRYGKLLNERYFAKPMMADATSSIPSTFRQISLARTFIPGVTGAASAGRGRPQRVTDELVKNAIDSMKKDIVRALAGGVTATA